MDNIPFIQSFIYYRLKENTNSNYIHVSYLKQVIWRVVKNNGGIPRYYTSDIIKDLEMLNLIKRIDNNGKFQILESKCDKKIKIKESELI